jgi:hypothetical protein
MDTVLQSSNWATSKWLEIWDVTAIGNKITLTPAESTIEHRGTVNLTATLQDGEGANGNNITYRWAVSGGNAHLLDTVGHSGDSFDSTRNVVSYSHDGDEDGTNIVTVEVFQGGINEPGRRSLGKATASIKIEEKGEYVLKAFTVDDNLTVWLNGVIVFDDARGAFAGLRGPYTLPGKPGDTLRIQVQDWYGFYAGVYDPIILVRPDGTERTLAPSFQTQTPSGNRQIVFDSSFTLD